MNIVIVIDCETCGYYMTANRFAEELIWHGHSVKTVAVGKNRISGYQTVIDQITLAKPKKSKIKRAFEGADIIHFIFPLRFEKKCRRIADGMGIPVASAVHE